MPGYRIHISDVMENGNFITFGLVVNDVTNVGFTHGGGYVTIPKPITEIALDTAVLKIVAEGNNAYPRDKEAIREGKTPVPDGVDARYLQDMARQKNLEDFPGIGQQKRRRR